MKHFCFLLFALIVCSVSNGQTPLPESRRSSTVILVYKLNHDDMRALFLKNKKLSEEMLHTFVMSCTDAGNIPELPRGNYITVRASGNNLQYDNHPVDNFYYSFVNDENIMLMLADTLGNVIGDAKVKRGAKKLRFDDDTKTYNIRNKKDKTLIEIDNGGVLHYIYLTDYSFRFNNRGWQIKNFFRKLIPRRNPYDTYKSYDGFVVFSKPKYKPGETVKFKAYVHRNGKPYNDEVKVNLVSHYPQQINKTLTKLKPYRPGMFEWEFPLSDSLKLTLDNNYEIRFGAKNWRVSDLSGSFWYEDYELGRITFSPKANKDRYARGDTVKITAKTEDDNSMPVYDGNIKIRVRPSYDRSSRKMLSDTVFIPNLIWEHTFDMEQMSEKELTLPDSLFLKGVSMSYRIECIFTDASNELHSKNINIYYDARERIIDFSIDKGLMTIREIAGGKSIATPALLTAYTPETEIARQERIELPCTMPLVWHASDYEVETETASGNYRIEDSDGDMMAHSFLREGDNVRLVVDNPAGIPFWYSIKKNNRVIGKSRAEDNLDHSLKAKDKSAYSLQIAYILGDETRVLSENLSYYRKNISLEVDTPSTIWPGQTANVEVSVTDKKGRPVKNADITAYAHTSKFGGQSPNVAIYGKAVRAKGFFNPFRQTDKDVLNNAQTRMDWTIWKERMGLDSIEYYRFLYPGVLYSYSEPAPANLTQISPYAVLDGEVQGVHILWIDEQPYYFSQSGHYNVYSFPVRPGYHTVRMRTHDREVTVKNLFVKAGKRNIISVDCSASATYNSEKNRQDVIIAVVEYDKKQLNVLTDTETAMMEKNMITIDNNFGIMEPLEESPPAILSMYAGHYYLNHNPKLTYNYMTRTYTGHPILVGPFPYGGIASLQVGNDKARKFRIEGGYDFSIWPDYIKQTSWKQTPISRSAEKFTPNPDFKSAALTPFSIQDMYNAKIKTALRERSGYIMGTGPDKENVCELELSAPISGSINQPVLIHVAGVRNDNPAGATFYGSTRYFSDLPTGSVEISLIFRDSTRHTVETILRKDGLNYIRIDSIRRSPADSLTRSVFAELDMKLIPMRPADHLATYGTTRAPSLSSELDDAVVVAYGTQRKSSVVGSVSLDYAFSGSVAGVQSVRGMTVKKMTAPVIVMEDSEIIIGNASFNESLSGLLDIFDVESAVLNDASEENPIFSMGSGAHSIRANFSDDAFWQPKLTTDNKGKLNFEVTYPDDITGWTANFIAVGGRKKTDKAQLKVKSFKPLNAQLSVPSFMTEGDSLNVVGRLTNHTGGSLDVARTIDVGGTVNRDAVNFDNSYVDRIPVVASSRDSIRVEYTLETDAGYLDGERRFIPVLAQGVSETYGEFAVLNDTVTRLFTTDPDLGAVTVHAEASAVSVLLDEIAKVANYPYMCNEQMASKIKALVSKKRICRITGVDFREDRKISSLMNKLNKNRNDEDLWGWWNSSKTELWISRQIVEAMLEAEKEGYEADFNKHLTTDALISELNRGLAQPPQNKIDLWSILMLLRKLDADVDYVRYCQLISTVPDSSLNEKLRSAEAAWMFDLKNKPTVDSIIGMSSKTLLGSIYWEEPRQEEKLPRVWIPTTGDTENTLTAYRILKMSGAEENLLADVRNWFFERRRNGSWCNIYESSRILETILPDMLGDGETFGAGMATVNGQKIDEIPFTKVFEAGTEVSVSKSGTPPVFLTVYQQAWNPEPDKCNEGFEVETWFEKTGEKISELKSGEVIELKVSVGVDSNAGYVMIEVPVPAGCSYVSKGVENFRKEVHREYYKDKVVIFCTRLAKGEHEFTIRLNPRYSGTAYQNPARVELMYFPTIFGRNAGKSYNIE